MTRNLLLTLILALAALVAPMASPARADDAPTREQLDAAKKAYGEGKALHDAGKLAEAIEKFKESYRLSRNSVLLYNIALTLDENRQSDNALFYYRKFLSDAPPEAAQRRAATDRVKQLEQDKLEADLNGKPVDGKPAEVATRPAPGRAEVKIKPPGTYQASEFQHQVVEDAPPGKALDLSSFVPADAGWTVTLYYRAAGDASFVAKPMIWHYRQLIARIPAAKVSGSSIQYYIEVKDQAGTFIARSGKSTSPNLINLDASAQPHYFPDFTEAAAASKIADRSNGGARHGDDEDPLGKKAPHEDEAVETTAPTGPAGEGLTDVGSSKFEKVKWGTTIGAVALVGAGVAFAVMAGNQASALADDTRKPHGACTATPCPFDAYDAGLQTTGKRDQTIANVAFTVGAIGAVVAGYFWVRELSHKKHGDTTARTTAASPERTWWVAPSFGDHFSGAAAAVRF